jgi:hypothetical protein
MSFNKRLEALEQALRVTNKSFRLTDTYVEAIQIELDNPDKQIFQMILNDCDGRKNWLKHNETYESAKIYVASHTASKFHQQLPPDDPKIPYIRGMFGPYGSGKSVSMVWDILYSGYLQKPQKDGMKRLKPAVIRNTKQQLKDTTITTFQQWFGHEGFVDRHMRQVLVFEDMQIEILFRALDKPKDVSNLLSLEVSLIFINECKEIARFVWENAYGRTGRSPSKAEGGTYRRGLIFDSNFPSNVHYLHEIFEKDRPIGHTLYKQPGGLTEKAENLDNLEEGYYDTLGIGKRKEWVRVYRDAKYGFTLDGKPVHPDFESSVHVVECGWIGGDIVLGLDWGRTPCCAILQEVNGQYQMIDEIITDNMGAKQFGKVVSAHVKKNYLNLNRNIDIKIWGDPSGEHKAQADDIKCFQMFNTSGLLAMPAPGNNNVTMRREALDTLLLTLHPASLQPNFIVSPVCKTFIAAMSGAFKYRKLQVSGEDRYTEEPDKSHPYSDIVEACEYALVGEGCAYEALMPGHQTQITVQARQ